MGLRVWESPPIKIRPIIKNRAILRKGLTNLKKDVKVSIGMSVIREIPCQIEVYYNNKIIGTLGESDTTIYIYNPKNNKMKLTFIVIVEPEFNYDCYRDHEVVIDYITIQQVQ
jgi:hypothetical protein